MKKIGIIYKKIFYTVAGMTFLWLFLIAFYHTATTVSESVLIFLSCCILIVMFGKKVYDAIDEKKLMTAYVVLSIICAGVMLYIAWNLRVSYENTWDYGKIVNDAIHLAKRQELDNWNYYSRYPNNLMLLCLLREFFKGMLHIFPSISSYGLQSCSIVLNWILIQFSLIVVYRTLQMLWGKKKSALAGIVMLLSSPMYLYASIAYTDTFSFPFVVGQFYFFVRFQKELKKRRWLYFAFAVLLGCIGFKLKMTIVFVLIAIVINLFLQADWKKLITGICVVAVLGVLVTNILGNFLISQTGVTEESLDRYQFPYAHWVMMTLKWEGGYNQEDVDYTASFENYDKKNEADIREIKKRIQKMGFSGFVYHVFVKKIIRTWGSGSMAGDDYISRQPLKKNKLQSLLCINGKYHKIYLIYAQSYHLLMLFWMFVSILLRWRQTETDEENVLVTTIWGLAIFLCIWECNSRYLVQMLPLMLPLMMSGIYGGIEKCQLTKKKIKKPQNPYCG